MNNTAREKGGSERAEFSYFLFWKGCDKMIPDAAGLRPEKIRPGCR